MESPEESAAPVAVVNTSNAAKSLIYTPDKQAKGEGRGGRAGGGRVHVKQRSTREKREARRHGRNRGSEEASVGDGRKSRRVREGEGCEELTSKRRHAGGGGGQVG